MEEKEIIKERLNAVERENLSFMNRLDLWWFFHSTPNGETSYNGNSKNIYCSWLNCCPGNLELKYNKCLCKEEKVFFCLCFTIMYL
jgi:hypothetical protein